MQTFKVPVAGDVNRGEMEKPQRLNTQESKSKQDGHGAKYNLK